MTPQEQYKAETGKDIWEKKDYTHTLHYVEWMKNYVKNSNSKEAKMVLAFARKLQSYNDKTNSMTNEEWVNIPGLMYFQASSQGQIRSTDRVVNHKRNGPTKYKGKILSQYSHKAGYKMITINDKMYTVHGLVALSFLGNRPIGYAINHKNGLKNDNRVVNLEYCTPSENNIHAYNGGDVYCIIGNEYMLMMDRCQANKTIYLWG